MEPTTEQPLAKFDSPRGDSALIFAPGNFEMAQRMATALSKSDFIPQQFKNNLPNCLIALEMASRMNASPMAVMQNLYIVHGKPAWSSQFVIAAVNSTGRFSPLRFSVTGSGDDRTCVAWAVELATKEKLEGPPVSIDIAKKEGWYGKNGSKWQTMPELMLRYRAATFFGRLYAPEVLMGMKEEGEIIDVETTPSAPLIEGPKDLPTPPPKPEKPARGKKSKAEPPADEPKSKLQIVREKLAESGHDEKQLIKLAITNNWTETTTKSLEELDEKTLDVFADDWDSVLVELAELKK